VTEFDPPRRRTRSSSANGSLVYHTKDCQAFVRVVNWVEVTQTEQALMQECRYCSDSLSLNDGGDKGIYQAALAHDPEEARD